MQNDPTNPGMRKQRATAVLLIVSFLFFTVFLFGDMTKVISDPNFDGVMFQESFWILYSALAYGSFSMTSVSWLQGRVRFAGVLGVLVVAAAGLFVSSTLRTASAEAVARAEQRQREASEGLERTVAELQPLITALVAFDPDAKVASTQDILKLARNGEFELQRDGGKLAAAVDGAVLSALKRTTDGALQGYLEARTRMLDELSKVSADDCVMVISGGGDVQSSIRIRKSLDPVTMPLLRDAYVRVLMEAAGRPLGPVVSAQEAEALLQSMSAPLKAANININWLRAGSSANERCDAHRALSHLTLQLSEPDRSKLMRVVLLGH